MGAQKVAVGAGVLLFVNGKLYAKIIDFTYESETPVTEENGVDTGEPFELIPAPTRVSGTLTLLRIIGDAGLEGSGITTAFERIPEEKYVTLQLIDRVTKQVLFQCDSAKIVRQSWQHPAKGMVRGSAQFRGVTWANPAAGT
jgi:hypothetical protein